MRVAFVGFGVISALILAAFVAQAKPTTNGVANASLAAAARRATLKDIDYASTCDGGITIDAWLRSLAGRDARAINWTGGKCQLVNKLNPLDGGGQWCARATISLVHPKGRNDKPTIEIYLESPKNGQPGAAFAFRSFMMTRDGNGDYLRFRKDFEAEWRERFPAEASPPVCED